MKLSMIHGVYVSVHMFTRMCLCTCTVHVHVHIVANATFIYKAMREIIILVLVTNLNRNHFQLEHNVTVSTVSEVLH